MTRVAGLTPMPVDVYIPGSPPRPLALIQGLLLALDRTVEAPRPA